MFDVTNEEQMQKLAAAVEEARFEYFVPRFAKHAAQHGITFNTEEDLAKAASIALNLIGHGAKPVVEKTASQELPVVADEFDKEGALQIAQVIDAVA